MATLTTRQQVTFTIEVLKDDGTQGEVQDGSVVVASSDETVITVSLSADSEMAGVVAAVAASDNPARFTVQADADLGTGVSTITGVSEDITVTTDPRDAATTFRITLGAPEDKPAPPGP